MEQALDDEFPETMNAEQVRALVEAQIAGRWNESNDHGVDLRLSLVTPIRIPLVFRRVVKGEIKDLIIEAWLVLEENPETKDGYKIIFDEARMTFGLASQGFPEDQHLVVSGFYGDFWTTFKGM